MASIPSEQHWRRLRTSDSGTTEGRRTDTQLPGGPTYHKCKNSTLQRQISFNLTMKHEAMKRLPRREPVEKDSLFQTLCALIKKRKEKKKDVPFISYLVPLPSKNSSLHSERGARLAAGYYSVREQLQSKWRETPKSARKPRERARTPRA